MSGAMFREVRRDLRFTPFGHVEPVERLVDKLGRPVRIIHLARERQALHGMNAILCDNAHAGSLEPMHRPTVPRRRIALRQKGMQPQVAVGGWLAVTCQLASAPVAQAPRISTANAPEITGRGVRGVELGVTFTTRPRPCVTISAATRAS